MTKKQSIGVKILKALGQKRVISVTELKQMAFPVTTLKESLSPKKICYAITRAVKNLKEDGVVDVFKSEHGEYVRLTNKGFKKSRLMNIQNSEALLNLSWDGFWRIILLDIGEDRKNERDAVRYLLKKAGFLCLKNSVWVSPYPYEHLFTNIKKDLGFTSEMMIIVTNNLDEETKKEFIRLNREAH